MKTINFEDLLKSIYDSKSQIEEEKEKISTSLREVEELRENLKNQNSDVSNKEKELITNAKLEAKQILLDAKETANTIIKDISSTSSASQANKLRNNLNEKISSIGNNINKVEVSQSISKDLIKPGLEVFVSNLNNNGTVLSNVSKDNTVQVQVGAMKMNVDIKFLQEAKKASSNKFHNKITDYTKHSSFKAQSISPEINILGMTVDEAIPIVDKYLDDCFIAKLSPVRIVHGKGTGALRSGIHRFLKSNKLVDSFRLGTFGEGEMGVTIVNLKMH